MIHTDKAMPHALSTHDPAEPLVVLETSRPPRPVVRYLDQVVGDSGAGISFRYADGKIRDLSVGVLHLHPHRKITLLGTEETASRHRFLAVLVFVLRFSRKGIPIVRTIQGPSDETPTLAQRLLDRATTLFIVLDPSTRSPAVERTVVIPHMHYRERYNGYPRSTMIDGRITCFTSTLTPSTALALANSAGVHPPGDLAIRVVGATDEALSNSLRAAADRTSSHFSAWEDALSDGAIVQEICAAELIVVPRYETMDDLQITFMALSLDRPVLLPAGPAAQRLREEVGSEWVFTSDAIIDAAEISSTLAATRRCAHNSRPNLDRRDPQAIYTAYAEAFRSLYARPRRHR